MTHQNEFKGLTRRYMHRPGEMGFFCGMMKTPVVLISNDI
jgi:hypothetical protein